MKKIPTDWNPIAISEVAKTCGHFTDWVLCGGHSVALIAGKDTRSHGDLDIGVFRSQAEECLKAIGKERVFLCLNGTHVAWDGLKVPEEVHDIWIADEECKYWALQIMIYEDAGNRVYYRRNREISWLKASHSIEIGGMKVLNPFITFLFKANKAGLEDKEMHDLMLLIEYGADRSE